MNYNQQNEKIQELKNLLDFYKFSNKQLRKMLKEQNEKIQELKK